LLALCRALDAARHAALRRTAPGRSGQPLRGQGARGGAALWLRGLDLSLSAAVGFIALGGVAVEIGVVMLAYLDQALKRREAERAIKHQKITLEDIRAAVIEGALLRIRPVTMTKVAIIAALLPILWSHGTGSEAMQRIAAPMVGGMLSVAVLTLAVIPAAYFLWQAARVKRSAR